MNYAIEKIFIYINIQYFQILNYLCSLINSPSFLLILYIHLRVHYYCDGITITTTLYVTYAVLF